MPAETPNHSKPSNREAKAVHDSAHIIALTLMPYYTSVHAYIMCVQALGCPYTEGAEDAWIVELVFKPGEPRIRLLQWLLSK